MLDWINETRAAHIVTIEDPIEYLHHHKKSAINQREVGEDTLSFGRRLRSVLREDPDVLLVGEMRDLESIQTTLTIAETGHLVLATLHTNDTATALDRIVDVFPTDRQQQIRLVLAVRSVAVRLRDAALRRRPLFELREQRVYVGGRHGASIPWRPAWSVVRSRGLRRACHS